MEKRIAMWVLGSAWGCLGSWVVGTVAAVVFLAAVLAAVLNAANPFNDVANAANDVVQQQIEQQQQQKKDDGQAPYWTGPGNKAVVDTALDMAQYVHVGPPSNQAQWYDEDPAIMQRAIAYWQRICAGCWYWQEGKLQCVMFVIAAYALAGQEVPYAGDAYLWWSNYQGISGWSERMNPFSATDPPVPGDIAVWGGGDAGHVAVVTDIKLPGPDGQGGLVQVAQANTPEGSIDTYALVAEGDRLLMQSKWGGYTILGFIRHTDYAH